ncbi:MULTISPECIES: site-specific integrase [unclassified Sphingomonas]|uniref:site-specific integrase n=1 Tax=unclassified Sphingomonas TaxID=196159 RepID=UPI000E73F567|nr:MULTISPECIES: site-specific integrase [unclassified Sphingomonas]RKE47370.1 site-specific recombinase XerD [Sphingomonas sp. PP-CC-1A-547]TCM07602.1 site-specific recombinase XerD [Sphingomonas sp. PP-CC-3G-468]
MPKLTLTSASALLAQCEPKKRKTDYYDDTVTGFVLECRSSGGKSYYLRFDQAGRQKQFKIGRFEDITFAAAKKAAQKLRSEVVMGGDPSARKAEAKAVPVYAELAAMHMADAELHQRSFTTTKGYMEKHIIPKWAKVRLTDIDSRSVAHWLAAKRNEGLAPATVLKIKMIFSRSFELGARWGISGCDKNPIRAVQSKPVNNARQRYVTADEAAKLIAAAEASRNRQLAAIVSLLLLTGMRVSELLSAKWANVDLDRRTLFVPTSKTGRSRFVPLAQAAVDVIDNLPRGEFLFPNPRDPAKHLTTIKHGWQTARDVAGLPGLRIHDLRHSAASFMVNSGVDLFAVGKVLGHANVASTARYSHLANDTLLAAVEAGAAKQAQPT